MKNNFKRIIEITGKVVTYSRLAVLEDKNIACYVGGWLGHQNLGDEALYIAMQEIFNDTKLIHYDGNRTLRFVNNITNMFSFGILGGGTLINQSEVWLKLAMEFQRLNKNMVVFGSGVANPSFWTGREWWRDYSDEWQDVLSECQYVGVRGPDSKKTLNDIGIPNVEIIGDPTLVFTQEDYIYQNNSKILGINIGFSEKGIYGDPEKVFNEIIRLVQLAKNDGWEIHWFIVWPEDEAITIKAAKMLGMKATIHRIYNDPFQYIERIKSVDVFVGMKLHSVVLAACVFVPLVMLEYRPKCSDFMKSINQEGYCVRTDVFKGSYVFDMMNQLMANRFEASMKIKEAVISFKRLQQDRSKQIYQVLDNSKRSMSD